MKIIQALKQIKDLKKKADDILAKVKEHSADLDCNTPTYPDQRRQVSEWAQSYSDIIKEILRLHIAIQKTNLETNVTIELGNKQVTKSIAEWIHRRKALAEMERLIWLHMTDKGLKSEYKNKITDKAPERTIQRVLYYDPVERDNKVELFRSEPSKIDSTLEVINAVTDIKD